MKWLLALLFVLAPVAEARFELRDHGKTLVFTREAAVQGEIDFLAEFKFDAAIIDAEGVPGPQVITINSPGGDEAAGRRIIALVKALHRAGHLVVCIVNGDAASMAFNLLTACDRRYATPTSKFLFHKIYGLPPMRPTSKNLRAWARTLDQLDEPYRRANAKALHMSLRTYDRIADQDRNWTAKELLKRGYLDGTVTIGTQSK